jgi:hypothetical protein
MEIAFLMDEQGEQDSICGAEGHGQSASQTKRKPESSLFKTERISMRKFLFPGQTFRAQPGLNSLRR